MLRTTLGPPGGSKSSSSSAVSPRSSTWAEARVPGSQAPEKSREGEKESPGQGKTKSNENLRSMKEGRKDMAKTTDGKNRSDEKGVQSRQMAKTDLMKKVCLQRDERRRVQGAIDF